MKFAVVVVIVALAYGASCSVLPLGLSPLGLHAPLGLATSIAGPTWLTTGHGATVIAPGQILAQGPVITSELAPGGIATSIVGPAPGAATWLSTPVIAAQGAYIAKTRGAVHTAPLPGHINSASSINLEPAPGTL